MQFYENSNDLEYPILKVHEWVQEAQKESVALPHAMNISTINDINARLNPTIGQIAFQLERIT